MSTNTNDFGQAFFGALAAAADNVLRCHHLGLSVGDRVEVISEAFNTYSGAITAEDLGNTPVIAELQEDDDTSFPYFVFVSGVVVNHYLNAEHRFAISLRRVRVIADGQRTTHQRSKPMIRDDEAAEHLDKAREAVQTAIAEVATLVVDYSDTYNSAFNARLHQSMDHLIAVREKLN